MAELKPCPFCGGASKLVRQITPLGKKQWTVKCDCGVLLRYRNRRWKAIEAWNRRYEPQGEIEFDYGAEV